MDLSTKAVKVTSAKSVLFQSKLLLVALAIVIPSMQSQAATATNVITVSATVLSACLVTATPLAFGLYDTAGLAVNATSSVGVTCTGTTSYTIALGAGAGTGATFASRKMTDGTQMLNYSIYTNNSLTTVWGDGTAGSSVVSGTGTLGTVLHSVYGKIPAGQAVNAGVYSDAVTVTLTY